MIFSFEIFGFSAGTSPHILLKFRIISFVSFTEVSLGFFRCKSLKSLAFLGPDLFRSSSFNDFLNGTFFSLISYIIDFRPGICQGVGSPKKILIFQGVRGLKLRSEFGPAFE